jgi:hypothetical protein
MSHAFAKPVISRDAANVHRVGTYLYRQASGLEADCNQERCCHSIIMAEAASGEAMSDADGARAATAAAASFASDCDAGSIDSSGMGMVCRNLMCTAVGVKPTTCKLCDAASDEPSPLASGHEEDAFGGLRPWLYYKPHPDKPGFKVARGRLCRLCNHTFAQSSHAAKFGSISAYVAHIRGGPSDKHATFLACLKEYIRIHNHAPQRHRVKCRDELEATESVKTHQAEGLRENTGYFFVELDMWKLENPGQTPAKIDRMYLKHAKCEKEGVWIKKGKQGYHEFESYRDLGVDKELLLEDCLVFITCF